jgi:hypothetical protein
MLPATDDQRAVSGDCRKGPLRIYELGTIFRECLGEAQFAHVGHSRKSVQEKNFAAPRFAEPPNFNAQLTASK